MKHVFLMFLLLVVCLPAFAQPPEIAWETDLNYSMECVRPVEREGLICAGNNRLIRLDDDGNTLWTRPLALERAYDMEVCADGGFIIGGEAMGTYQIARVIKTNYLGVEQWRLDRENMYSDDSFFEVAQSADGTFICLKRNDDSIDPTRVRYELDSDGTVLEAGFTDNIYIKPYDNCDFVFDYHENSYYGEYYDELQKHGHYNNSWEYSFSFSNDSRCRDVVQLHNYNIVLSVFCNYEENLMVFNPFGDVLLEHPMPGLPWRILWLHETADHKLICAGASYAGPYISNTRLMKLDTGLVEEWSTWHSFTGGQDVTADFCVANDGGYVFTNGPSVIKFNPEIVADITPDTQDLPHEGGVIHFDVTMDNHLLEEETLDLWVQFFGQFRRSFTVDLSEMTLAPGQTYTYSDSVQIPGTVPDGSYICRFHVGDSASRITAGADRFVFRKGAADVASLDGQQFDATLPENLSLSSYPNPFNAMTTVTVGLAEETDLTATVFNIAGQRVATLASGSFAPGEYRFEFDGNALSSGIYLVHVQAGREQMQKKVMLLR